MNGNIVVPDGFDKWQLLNPTPEQQIEYFRTHDKVRMSTVMWKKFYCQSLQHKGLCCSSCLGDEEYEGVPNFDDKCCCEAVEPKSKLGEDKR